jgi:hypothetical protein
LLAASLLLLESRISLHVMAPRIRTKIKETKGKWWLVAGRHCWWVSEKGFPFYIVKTYDTFRVCKVKPYCLVMHYCGEYTSSSCVGNYNAHINQCYVHYISVWCKITQTCTRIYISAYEFQSLWLSCITSLFLILSHQILTESDLKCWEWVVPRSGCKS